MVANNPCLTACAAALRAASSDIERTTLRNRLAGAIRGVAIVTLRGARVPADIVEDLAQDLTVEVAPRIEQGHVTPGSEGAYVRRCALNCARDHFRQQSGVFVRAQLRDADVEEVASTDEDPERQLVHLEDSAAQGARVRAVRSVLDTAPPRYRDALVAVYLEGRAVEELVAAEMERRGSLGVVAHEAKAEVIVRKRARDTVDQLLARARGWVRDRLGRTGT